jgi:uncharacterized protein YyaL (SSP411 family)
VIEKSEEETAAIPERQKLWEAREQRPKPFRDEKIIAT